MVGKDVNPDQFSKVMLMLRNSHHKPTLTFSRVIHIDDNNAIYDLLLHHRDVLPVVTLDVWNTTLQRLHYISKFHHLEQLTILPDNNEESRDLYRHLDSLQNLRKLTVLLRPEPVTSFPRNLHILRLYKAVDRAPILHATWTAVCDLRSLEELTIRQYCAEGGPPCRFQSANLRTFCYGLEYDDPSDSTSHQHISTVFKACHRLSCADLDLPRSVPAFSIVPASDILTSLTITNDCESNTFENLTEFAQKVPNVRQFKSYWPLLSNQEIYTPTRLTDSQAQRLSKAFTKLAEIEFILNNMLWTDYKKRYDFQAPEFQTIPNSLFENMPLDSKQLGSGKLSHYFLVQLFEAHLLNDGTSPCLQICTAFSPPSSPAGSLPSSQADILPVLDRYRYRGVSVFLSLKQVRRHHNHLY